MDISEIKKKKSHNSSPLMIAVVSIFSILSFFAGFGNGFFSALAQLIACVILLPLAWKLGDLFCNFTMPDFFLSSGALDTFSKKLFWKIGPQLITVIISWFFIFIAVADFTSINNEERQNQATKEALPIQNKFIKEDINPLQTQSPTKNLSEKPNTEEIAHSLDSNPIKPSFDCNKAQHQVEIMICNSEELAILDNEIVALYKSKMSATVAPEKIKTLQVAWIKEQRLCKDNDCLLNGFKNQISALNSIDY